RLPTADHQLIVFYGDRDVFFGEAGDGERDAVRRLTPLLDIVRRVSVRPGFLPLDQAIELLEPEQKRMLSEGEAAHRSSPCKSDYPCAGPEAAPAHHQYVDAHAMTQPPAPGDAGRLEKC